MSNQVNLAISAAPYSAFDPAKVFLPSKITYLLIASPTHKHEPGTVKGQRAY
jgi:hypothetical protein